jgi:hypothetical protein
MIDDTDTNLKNKKLVATDENPDPITGEPGAHPVGTGAGAILGGAAAGAAAGTLTGGPVGTVVGIVAGAIAGGLGGKAVAESVNPTAEDAYWRENHLKQPYYDKNYTYEDYQGAYRTGYEGYSRHAKTGKKFDDIEADLQRDYEKNRGQSRLEWERAREASRSAWMRLEKPANQGTENRNLSNTDSRAAQELRDIEDKPRSQRQRTC